MNVTAVVLAGGGSRRFGSDKLAVPVDQHSLLDHTLAGLPADFAIFVVGPERVTRRPVTFTRERPPGGGPAAGLIAGVRAAHESKPDAIVVLPGDAPAAGRGTAVLLDALGHSEVESVVATDADGRWQPLQLALRPTAARQLMALAGPDGAAGQSARRLVARLDPPPLPVRLAPDHAFDVDTPAQLLIWRLHTGPGVSEVVEAIAARRSSVVGRALVVAIDGPSGAGKSTVAAALALRTGGTAIDGDDFYHSGLAALNAAERDRMSDVEVAATVIDWRRLRAEALEPLRQGRAATYYPYDWESADGRLTVASRHLAPGDPVIVEGVYSARPELADLIDLTVHVETAPGIRAARLAERGDQPDWAAFWERGEQHYFRFVRPPASFDLRIDSEPNRGGGDHTGWPD